jgi:ABC-type uncharacterized transport system permease subunit
MPPSASISGSTRWRETDRSLVTLPMQPWERAAIFGALAVQGLACIRAVQRWGGMRFSFSFALSLMLWLAVLIYWLESFRSRMDGLQPMVLPLAALSCGGAGRVSRNCASSATPAPGAFSSIS